MSKPAADLKPGVVILHRHAYWLDDNGQSLEIRVTVLREKETGTEDVAPLAGRPCIRYWCRREDTGKEGYMTYGLAGVVIMTHDEDQPNDGREA